MASAEWRFHKLPHAQRVALREVMLRGAARDYAQNANTSDEDAAAATLREAAIDYAVTLLQRAGSEGAPGPRGEPQKPTRKTEAP